MQKTIRNKIQITGKGLHTGIITTACFIPTKPDTGIKFRRIDLKNKPYIDACVNNVYTTKRRTVLRKNEAVIETVEHVLAAVFALSINNLLIELNGPELPILDGSSKIFIETLEKVGIKTQNKNKHQCNISHYFKVEDDDSKIEFFPQDKFEVKVTIDYESNLLKTQTAEIHNLLKFKKEISPARTFCFLHELNQLINYNLIKGGDLNNGIVLVEKDIQVKELGKLKNLLPKSIKTIKKGVLNNKKLLYPNEPARHKLLDLIGDITLAGVNISGKIQAYKPGHKINIKFAEKLKSEILKQKNIMKTKPIMRINDIKKILPHREPFLFIDEIKELGHDYVIGMKYVNRDELSKYWFK